MQIINNKDNKQPLQGGYKMARISMITKELQRLRVMERVCKRFESD